MSTEDNLRARMLPLALLTKELVLVKENKRQLWVHNCYYRKSLTYMGINVFYDYLAVTEEDLDMTEVTHDLLKYRMLGETRYSIFFSRESVKDDVHHGPTCIKSIEWEEFLLMSGGSIKDSVREKKQAIARFECLEPKMLMVKGRNCDYRVNYPFFGDYPNDTREIKNRLDKLKKLRRIMADREIQVTKKGKGRKMREKELDKASVELLSSYVETSKYVTKDMLSVYCMNRHEVVVNALMSFMNLESKGKSDVDMEETYNYFGPASEKTPDIVYTETGEWAPNDFFLIDVAVTDTDPSRIQTIKADGYENLRHGLSMSAAHEFPNVKFGSVVVPMKHDEMLLLPDFLEEKEGLRDHLEDVMKDLYEINKRIMLKGGYSNAKAIMREAGGDEENQDKEEFLKEVVDVFSSAFNLSDKKSYQLKDSYTDPSNTIPSGLCTN